MKREAVLAPVILVILGLASVTAHGAEPSPALKALIEAANKEGALSLSHGQSVLDGTNAIREIETKLNAEFGTKIKIDFVPAQAMMRQANQIALESSAGQKANTDVFIGPPAAMKEIVERNVASEVDWVALLPDRIRPEFVEGKGRALRFGVTFPVIAYNTQRAKMVPRSLEDMLRPEWKGDIAANSYLLGFEVLGSNGVWGREKTVDYVKKLSGQARGLIRCGAELERVATGEYSAAVMDCIGGNAITWQQRGAPIDYVIPTDAAQLHYYYLAVPKNAPHPNAAKLFTVFLMTETGQKLGWNTWKVDLDNLPGSQVGARVSKLKQEGVKFTEVTYDWWQQHPEVPAVLGELLKIIEKR